MTQSKLVFLGGTCGKNNWRDALIAALVARGVAADKLFNPVVADWTPECQVREDQAKETANLVVYYLADPGDGTGISTYSLVEATMALYDQKDRAVVVFDRTGMAPKSHPEKVMKKVEADLRKRFPDATVLNADQLSDFLAKKLS